MKLSIFSKTLLFSLLLVSFLEAKTISRTQVIMSTLVNISTDENNSNLIENAFDVVKNVDSSISSYKPDSIISKLNKDLYKIGLDEYSYEVLKLSQRYYKRTNGYFDITIGSTQDPQLREIIVDNLELILQGKLCLEIYKSAHKTDQLGFDRLNGGYILSVYNKKKFIHEELILTKKEEQACDLNLFGLCHFQKYIPNLLEQHHKIISNNANYVLLL